MAPSSYEACLAALYARRGRVGRWSLRPMRALLAALGHPERRLRQAVGVAGSNGKGSVSALLAAAAGRAGARVGLYTSPHLLRFTERIRVDGAELTPAAAVDLYAEVEAAARRCREPVSFFEATTAMAVLAFVAAAVDLAVFEVGLGGRLDATAAVPRQLAAITTLGLEHRALLGDSLGAIATEKAGIIARGRPVVIAPQAPEAVRALTAVAHRRGAPVWWARPQLPEDCAGGLLPAYQADNVAVARAAAGLLGVPKAAFAGALANFSWPGRYQRLAGVPPLLVDGAHNPPAMRALLAALAADREAQGRRWVAVVGALADKDVAAMLAPLSARMGAVVLCALDVPRGCAVKDWRRLAPHLPAHPSFAEALAAAHAADPEAHVLVTGSLFLVAEALAHAAPGRRDPAIAS